MLLRVFCYSLVTEGTVMLLCFGGYSVIVILGRGGYIVIVRLYREQCYCYVMEGTMIM